MGHKYEIMDRVLEVFFENPGKEFTVREIATASRTPKSTVQKYLQILKGRGLVTRDNSSSENILFRTMKINFYVERIVSSGLLVKLIEEYNPSCLILFGSIRKGDSVKESDIDIFIESFEKEDISLSEYERKLKHKVHLLIEDDMDNLSPHLYNNIANGIKLHGFFRAKEVE